MVKPVMMYFWIPNLLFGAYLGWKTKRKYPVILALLLLFTIGGWSYRNYKQTEYFHFSAIKTLNLLELNAAALLIHDFSHTYSMEYISKTEKKADLIQSYKSRSDFLLNDATRIIEKQPVLYCLLHAKSMFSMMLEPATWDIKIFFGQDCHNEVSLLYEVDKKGLVNGVVSYIQQVDLRILAMVLIVSIWNICSLTLLLLAFSSTRMGGMQRLFLFILLFYNVFACGSGAYARFQTSIFPLILYLLPFGYQVGIEIIEKLKTGSFLYKKMQNK